MKVQKTTSNRRFSRRLNVSQGEKRYFKIIWSILEYHRSIVGVGVSLSPPPLVITETSKGHLTIHTLFSERTFIYRWTKLQVHIRTYMKCHHDVFYGNVFCIFYRNILNSSIKCTLQLVVGVAPFYYPRLPVSISYLQEMSFWTATNKPIFLYDPSYNRGDRRIFLHQVSIACKIWKLQVISSHRLQRFIKGYTIFSSPFSLRFI